MMKRAFARAFSLLAVSISAVIAMSTASATTFTVGPGKTFATPEAIDWNEVLPGDKVVIYPGTYPSLLGTGNSMVINGVAGTADKPITVEGVSAADLPKLDAGILIAGGSEYVTLSNLDVSRNPVTERYAAVAVRGKSRHIVISGFNVHNSFVGVEFTLAGLQNSLKGSAVHDNVFHGVTASPPDPSFVPDAGHSSSISDNTIYGNGAHGIEITGPYWNVRYNQITDNGLTLHGTSGIHVYSTTDVSGAYGCNYNLIAYNYVSGQHDLDGTDGNGIQIDDFCDYNTIAYNVVWDNAGAGISVLDSKSTTVRSNTSYSNARDTGRVAKLPGVFRGEIILGSMANLCSNPYVLPAECHVPAGRSSDNVIEDNLIVSGQSAVPGMFVSQDAATRNTNYFRQNMYYNLGSAETGIELLWNYTPLYTAGEIDAATGQASRGGGSLVEAPHFTDTAAPAANGLRLSKKPLTDGEVISSATADMLGALPAAGDAFFGAYYTGP